MEICVMYVTLRMLSEKSRLKKNSYETLFYNIICDCDFVLVVVSMNDNQVLLCCKSLRSRKPFVLAKPSNFRMHRRHHCLLIAINKNNHEALTFWKSIETKQQ